MIHILLPAQYLAKRREGRGEPQTRLMLAVLQTVVDVQVDYEQAGDYLQKARSKQKVLDQMQ